MFSSWRAVGALACEILAPAASVLLIIQNEKFGIFSLS
jgi:hypothetical protein